MRGEPVAMRLAAELVRSARWAAGPGIDRTIRQHPALATVAGLAIDHDTTDPDRFLDDLITRAGQPPQPPRPPTWVQPAAQLGGAGPRHRRAPRHARHRTDTAGLAVIIDRANELDHALAELAITLGTIACGGDAARLDELLATMQAAIADHLADYDDGPNQRGDTP